MRSWKSTTLGWLAAVINLIASGVNWKSAIFSVTIGLLGTISKDYNVTGVSAPPSKDIATK